MDRLRIISKDESNVWNEIVKSFKDYDVCYLNGYAQAFSLQGEGEPLLIYYEDASTRAMNVVMKRDISSIPQFAGILPANTWFDLSTPYGYGGFWFDGEKNYEAVSRAYDEYCMKQSFVSEFTRFHLLSEYQQYYSGVSETHTHNVIRSLDLSLDDILHDFEYKVRKNLKRAEASGLKIEIDTTGAGLDDFLNIYYSTMDRTNARENFLFSKEFFRTIDTMQDNFVYLHVLYEGQVISTELVVYGSENCYSFLGGTNRDFFHVRPNDFLKFEIIKWAKEKGLKRFILGGGYGDDDGIFKYKKSLAPNGVCDFYIGKKIFNRKMYDELVEIRKKDAGIDTNTDIDINFDAMSGFFPKYRDAFGDPETAADDPEKIERAHE